MWFSLILSIIVVVGLHIGVLIYLLQRPRKSILGKHVVVTGGSDGIGRAIAVRAAQLGADVTLVARNTDKLSKFILLYGLVNV